MKIKGIAFKALSLVMGTALLFSVGCGDSGNGGNSSQSDSVGGGHTHVFDQQVSEEKFFKSEKTCTEATQYYYSCVCGEKGEESYSVGTKGLHSYTAEIAEEEYLITEATCQATATYYKSCSVCGKSSNSEKVSFTGKEYGDHVYDKKDPSWKFLVEEATHEKSAVYVKSCVCGEAGEETFSYGDPLKTLTDAEKEAYKPVSLSLTMYDAENSVYGFTYNTAAEPLRPVVRIQKGSELTDGAQEIGASFDKWSTYDKDENSADVMYSYYVCKAEVTLEPSTTYTYQIYDKYAEIGSETVTFTTRDPKAESFSFAHVSDTQSAPSSGSNFGLVLDKVMDDADFVLHTGDVVEYSKYEYEWTDMLHANFKYLSKMPVMALPGNHDTTYKSAAHAFWRHFNYKIPEQNSVSVGIYYSFTYGNAKFIMLNTNNNSAGALDKEQYDWLVNELKNNDSYWTIVAMHAPLYSIGQWGADPEKNGQSMSLRTQLKDVFAEYGVDLVFQGHDHLLSRTNPITADGPTTETWQTENGVEYSVDPDGVIYVMNGTVGTNAKGVVGIEEGIYKYAQASSSCTWANITIDGDTLTFEARNLDNVYHKWGIKKTA